MSHTHRILAVDVCGTLYDANTTAGLVMFHHSRRANRWRFAVLNVLTHRKSPFRVVSIAVSKLTGFDLHRTAVLLSLRGERVTSLEASAQRYVEDHLPRKAIPQTLARVDAMRAEGWEPVLVSNAISPVVSQIADKMGVRSVASQPKVKAGRLTGRLDRDLTGHKRRALEVFLNRSLRDAEFAVITDNRTDRDLVASADPAILIAHGKPRRWMKGFDAEIICP
ncbi:haloacid dehalogenase-like hydrolase [Aliiroseovarius sp. 2305UL8-7]|uniref:haloacid dehalogenase-like hydrolase n=1 Tax=Aliiroseovarius conchicola TaxID=3121637 RepID=UPI003529A16A